MNKSTNFANNALSIIKGHNLNDKTNFNSNGSLNGNKNNISNFDASLLKSVDNILNGNSKNKRSEDDKGLDVKINSGLKKLVSDQERNNMNSLINSSILGQKRTFKEIVDSITSGRTFMTKLNKKDDVRFSENEINIINKKLEKSKMKNVKIWEKSSQPQSQEKELNIRKKIFEIKRVVKEKGGLEIVDMNNQKFFSKEHLDVINESTKIIKEQTLNSNKQTNIPGKVNSIYEFIIDNREITMKNYVLDLLRSERMKINTKEGEVSKALKDSETKLEDDYKKFETFTEYERNKQKEMERVLLDAAKDNRELADRKKKLNQENKQIMDELERTVKAIRSYKGDAIFVHHVLGDIKSIKFRNDIDVISSKNLEFNEILLQKDSDLEKITDDLIVEFKYAQKEDKHEIPDLLKDPFAMIQTFLELEENILKLMDSKQNFDKESEKMLLENSLMINEFETREKAVRKERERLFQEKEKEDKIMKELLKSTSGEGGNSDIVAMLRDLYCIAIHGEDYETLAYNKRMKLKSHLDIKELMDNLRKMEFDVIEFVDVLEAISKDDEEKFKKFIHGRKEFNKFKKQEDQKKKSEAVANLKKEKAEERMHRIVVKGRNTMEHYLNAKGEKKKQMNMNLFKENDDYNMIYYEEND